MEMHWEFMEGCLGLECRVLVAGTVRRAALTEDVSGERGDMDHVELQRITSQ